MFAQIPGSCLAQPTVKPGWLAAFLGSVMLLFFFATPAYAQPSNPHLVKDINTATMNAAPDHFVAAGNTLYFVADDGLYGRELWKTDGSDKGTKLVKDIAPGSVGSEPEALFDFNGMLFFSAKDGDGDRELWKSDGTADGTVRVKDTNPMDSSSPQSFVSLNNLLYFTANDATHGAVLWRSDGTEANTLPVIDLYPGNQAAALTSLTVVNGAILLIAYEPISGVYGLWRSDGTANGTSLLKNINLSDAANLFEEHTVLNNTFYFVTQDNSGKVYLWKSDGTTIGTDVVSQITPSSGIYARVGPFIVMDDTLYFLATGDNNCGLWNITGTAGGTTLVTNACVGDSLVAVNHTLYFNGTDVATGNELWKSDGTPTGTVLVRDIVVGTGSSYPLLGGNVNGTLYFFADDQAQHGLWRSDGTAVGTTLVKKLDRGGIFLSANNDIPFAFYNWNGVAYFSAEDGQNLQDNDSQAGYELWKSDGTPVGTTLVKDMNLLTNSSYPQQLTMVGNTLYFLATDPVNAQELWRSNGAAADTTLLSDVNPNGMGARIRQVVGGEHLVYLRVDNDPASELWRSDGTVAGTQLVKQFADNEKTRILAMITAGDTLYFAIEETGVGWTLWKSDGTVAGTLPVKLLTATGLPPLEFLLAHQGVVYFGLAQKIDDHIQYQLWRSDGTADGTLPLKDIAPGWMIANGDTLYFSGVLNGQSGLWKSDGTTAGTVLVSSVELDDLMGQQAVMNGLLYFRGYDNVHNWELWKSDGTELGTVLVKDINPGSEPSDPGYSSRMVVMKGQLYFGAQDGNARWANLWKSDGTEAGTVLVKAIFSAGGGPYDLTVASNHLYFLDEQDDGNKELWVSDGTDASTKAVMNLNDNFAGGPLDYAVHLVGANNRIYFAARDINTGFELWTLAESGTVSAVNDLYTMAQGAVLTVSAPGVLSNDQASSNDSLSAILVTNPAHGLVTFHADGSFVYTPISNFMGSDSFIYRASNSDAISATASVSITVTPAGLPPVAKDDAITTTVTGPVTIDVTANDKAAAGANLTISQLTQPTHGTATITNNQIVYTPAADFNGIDSFTYTVSDGQGHTATATVTIHVQQTSSGRGLFLPLIQR